MQPIPPVKHPHLRRDRDNRHRLWAWTNRACPAWIRARHRNNCHRGAHSTRAWRIAQPARRPGSGFLIFTDCVLMLGVDSHRVDTRANEWIVCHIISIFRGHPKEQQSLLPGPLASQLCQDLPKRISGFSRYIDGNCDVKPVITIVVQALGLG